MMKNFWKNSGYSLLAVDADGRLQITDEYFKAYLERPELVPVAESCDNERALFEELKKNPRKLISNEDLLKLEDPEGRENYRFLIDFRDRLIRSNTIERCYLDIFSEETVKTPPIFLDQMVQVVLRQILDGSDDPMELRAAEIFFREQKVTIKDGAIMLGDAEIVKLMSRTAGMGNLGQLLLQASTRPRDIELDVLLSETASIYWERDEKFDTVLDITFPRPGLDALCRVMERWISHMRGVDVSIQPVQRINDDRWVWHIGLDIEATKLLNDLYQNTATTDERMADLLSLFRLEFKNPSLMRSRIAGRPVYLGLCRRRDGLLRFKPQNLLVNLPLATES